MNAKKFMLSLLVGLMSFSFIGCGDDDVSPNDVAPAVMNTFKQMYPTATNANWEREKNGQLKVDFFMDNYEMEAWFEADGTWVMTYKELTIRELPQAAIDYINQNYAGREIEDVYRVETPTGNYYLVEIDMENQADIQLKFSDTGTLVV